MSASRQPLVAGNWKMNLSHLEGIALVNKLGHLLQPADYQRVEVAVLPPFVDLRSVQTVVDGERWPLRYGGQDLSPHEDGAYTGDVSGRMLAQLGCTYVVVGHSERREHHHEGDEVVNAKVRAAARHALVPILCVGEPLEVRTDGGQVGHCAGQLRAALAGVDAPVAASLVIAYEPVWAIGTGRVATVEDAQEVCAALRGELRQLYGAQVAGGCRILYGGSVKAANAAELLAAPDVDGALVGGASLDAEEFAAICRAA